MNDEQYSAVGAYVGFLLHTLECSDWRVLLRKDEACDDDAHAMIHPTDGRKVAVLYLNREFFSLHPDIMRHALIHEVCHLLTRDMNDVMRLGLPALVGQPTYTALWEPYRLACEVATDTMAYAFAGLISDATYIQAIVDSGGAQ